MSDIILYIQEFFDINQPIGRKSFLYRVTDSLMILWLLWYFVQSILKIFINTEKLLPYLVIIILIIWLCLIICSSIKRARDIWSSWYIISWTIIITIIILLLRANEYNYKILSILHLNIVSIVIYCLLFIQLSYLILYPGNY